VNDWKQDRSLVIPDAESRYFKHRMIYLWIVPDYDRAAEFGEGLRSLSYPWGWNGEGWLAPERAATAMQVVAAQHVSLEDKQLVNT
jgi:hypothetical protein